jgi:multisubunit Na+/H+ antiporter MnhC subunit
MITAIAALFVLLIVFAAFLFFARRILRLALKLALVSAVVFALFAGGMFGWWRGWFEPSAPRAQRATSPTNQQRNTNRRPAR